MYSRMKCTELLNRYLDGPWDSPSHQLKLLLEETDDPSNSEHITAVTQLWCEIFNNEDTWLTTSVCVTCFAILWLAIKGERVSSMVATTCWSGPKTEMESDSAK